MTICSPLRGGLADWLPCTTEGDVPVKTAATKQAVCVQAKNVQSHKERMQAQEAEISALRRQLDSMHCAVQLVRVSGNLASLTSDF